MKKLLFLTAALALVFGLSQCRKPNASAINGGNGTQHVVLQASFDNGGSKIAEDGNGGIKWAVNDQIAVKQGETSLGTLNCTNAESGIFEGTITSTQGKITFTFGTQKFDEQTGTLDGAISLSSGEVTYNPEGSYTNVQMTMPHAVLKLDLSALGTAEVGNTVAITGAGENVSVSNVTNASDNPYFVAMPTNNTSTTYTFSGNGKTARLTWELEANKFYTKSGSSTGEAIVVRPPVFSVSATKTVEFAKGNLYWDGSAFKFEANQWDYRTWAGKNSCIGGTVSETGTPVGNCGLFKWADAGNAVTGDYNYSDNLFCASGFEVEGETWFTLSCDEWNYLLGYDPDERQQTPSYGRANAMNLCGRQTVAGVYGLVILPDNTENPGAVLSGITTAEDLAVVDAVFLPAAGNRYGTVVWDVGEGSYWSSTPSGVYYAYYVCFVPDGMFTDSNGRTRGYAVRLVR